MSVTSLAFILWHHPAKGVSTQEYEDALIAFHRSLRAAPPKGLLSSEVVRFDGLPWLHTSPAYQDWYLITGFEAMGILNEGAVAGSRRDPHDRVAALAADGIGGVYALEAGEQQLDPEAIFHWIQKPDARRTAEYLPYLRSAAAGGSGSLWRRQMNLGAAPEYCLRARTAADVEGVRHTVRGTSVW